MDGFPVTNFSRMLILVDFFCSWISSSPYKKKLSSWLWSRLKFEAVEFLDFFWGSKGLFKFCRFNCYIRGMMRWIMVWLGFWLRLWIFFWTQFWYEIVSSTITYLFFTCTGFLIISILVHICSIETRRGENILAKNKVQNKKIWGCRITTNTWKKDERGKESRKRWKKA